MTTITRSDDLRRGNRHRVLTAVRRETALSRIDIARVTGLSAATVTAIAGELVDHGLLMGIEDSDRPRAGRGRPKAALTIDPTVAVVVSTVFKRNTIASAVFDYAGELIDEQVYEIDTSELSVDNVRALLEQSIDDVLEVSSSHGRLRGIVVGVQGPTDINSSTLIWSPMFEHRNLPIGAWLTERFGVAVKVGNDCDMIAQSLHWQEPARFGDDFAAILLSYGVGMALFQSGRPMNGRLSSAMEFGHMTYMPDGAACRCGKMGCIEAYAGDYAISRRALGEEGAIDSLGEPDLDRIVKAAKAGDRAAMDAIHLAGAALGTGLANLFALTDPLPVALVGAGTKAFDLMEPHLRVALEDGVSREANTDIEITCFDDEMPIIRHGCAVSALIVIDREIVDLNIFREGDAAADD